MASNGKKIILFDASGALTKEALYAYVYGELPPPMRLEVEKHVADNEMYQDVIEGLKLLPDKQRAEKIISGINEQVAERSGSEVAKRGLMFDMSDFFTETRKKAAIAIGVLLAAGGLITLALYNIQPQQQIAQNEQQQTPAEQTQEELAAPTANSVDISNILSDTTAIMPGETITVSDETEKPLATTKETSLNKDIAQVKTEQKTVAASDKRVIEPEKKQEDTKQDAVAEDREDDKIQETTISNSDENNDKQSQVFDLVMESKKKELSDKKVSAPTTGYAQTARTEAEEMPEYPGGEAAMRQYIKSNLNYPKKAKKNGVQGKVYVTFVVDENGKVKEVRVAQGVDKELDAEAARLVLSMPPWKPGREKGQPVPVRQYLTIDFIITD